MPDPSRVNHTLKIRGYELTSEGRVGPALLARQMEHLCWEAGGVGPNDLMIAATARAHDLTLVTRNIGELSRVVALRVENWAA